MTFSDVHLYSESTFPTVTGFFSQGGGDPDITITLPISPYSQKSPVYILKTNMISITIDRLFLD